MNSLFLKCVVMVVLVSSNYVFWALTDCLHMVLALECQVGSRLAGRVAREGGGDEKEEERFIARQRREAMGRRSSLRDPAHAFMKVLDTNNGRAQEKAGSLHSE